MWFDAGIVFGCVALVLSMLLLTLTIVNMMSHQPAEQQILVPVVSLQNSAFNLYVYFVLILLIAYS